MKEFESTRAILTRKADDQTYYGWVQPGLEGQLLLKIESCPEFAAGEVFGIELHSTKHSTNFEANYRGSKQETYFFSLPKLIMMDQPSGQARLKRPAIKAEVNTGESLAEGWLLDLGTGGGAVIATASFESGSKIKIKVIAGGHTIEVDAEVIYSRFEQEEGGQFRTGFKIQQMSRIDQARWTQLLAS